MIELLIVIAIIGVLAATVVVSLGSQTESAQDGSVKIGVSSVRNLATVAAVEGKVDGKDIDTTNTLCDLVWKKVSGEKDGWIWNGKNECNANSATKSGHICCSSPSKEKWVIWAKINETVKNGNVDESQVYCADSSGFAGKVNVHSEADSKTSVEEGKAGAIPKTCKEPATG